MTISAHHLLEILQIIWLTQLDMRLEPSAATFPTSQETMTGVVQISGGFSGALHLRCSRALVAASASRMFDLPVENLNEADLRDALGELTNMTAGNIKTLLPGSDDVSLPTVVEGTDYGLTRLDSDLVAQADAGHEGHLMTACLFADC